MLVNRLVNRYHHVHQNVLVEYPSDNPIIECSHYVMRQESKVFWDGTLYLSHDYFLIQTIYIIYIYIYTRIERESKNLNAKYIFSMSFNIINYTFVSICIFNICILYININ